ncbi:MAG: hypothetical protein OEU46_03300 [Alphaproteobacteria bacterium]|nr:hypothetical protein [Alphaproteobacteria bacterium]
MKLRFVSIIVFAMMGANLAAADDTWRPDITVGPTFSTLGIGADVGVRLNDYIGLRVGGNYLSFDFDVNTTDLNYTADLTLASIGGTLDIYPFKRVLRLSAGFRYNGNSIDFTATPNGSVTIGGTTFAAADAGNVSGELDFNKFAPYLGVGLEGRFFDDKFILGTEAGVLFQGRPRFDLRGDGALAGDPTFEASLRQEEAAVEDDLSFFRYYPVVAIYAMLRF